MAKCSARVGLVVCGLMAVVMTACEESAVAPTDFAVVESAAFARKPGSEPGSPDKNKSCDDNENGRKTRNSPNSKNQCEGGGVEQVWTIALEKQTGDPNSPRLPIAGDSIHVCGPRASGGTCSRTDGDYRGSVDISSPTFYFVDGFFVVDGYAKVFTIPGFTASKPYVVVTPYRAGGQIGVGSFGNSSYYNLTTECDSNAGYHNYCFSKTFEDGSGGEVGFVIYGFGQR
jgi:hypothetical protein